MASFDPSWVIVMCLGCRKWFTARLRPVETSHSCPYCRDARRLSGRLQWAELWGGRVVENDVAPNGHSN